jgi:hypothetical protein
MGRIATEIAVALMAGLVGVQAQNTAPAAPGTRGVVLVELFTSEGCSSCPPADALLREVNGKRTKAGQWIVGISEHVTYWNGQGWSDPFSSEANTQRQNDYKDRFHLESVYTPQMVINGSQQIVGSARAAFLQAIEKEDQQPARLSLHIVSLSADSSKLSVSYSASGELPAHGADLIAALVDDSDQSSVHGGENSGQTLVHVSVARSLARVAKLEATGEKTLQLRLPSSFQGTQKHHLILFVQARGNGRVLAADTKAL